MRQFLNSGFRWGRVMMAVSFLWTMSAINPPMVHAQAKSSPVNVNTADLATLETLPGIGPTLGQRIIDGRPYKGATDLEKVSGMSKTKVDAIKDQITFGRASSTKPSTTSTTKPGTAGTAGSVNVNSADLATLETLPGIGPTLAQRIIDGRPYKNAADLEKVSGMTKAKVTAIEDQITFGPKTTTHTSKSTTPTTEKENKMPATGRDTSTTGKLAPGQKVNINTASAEQLDSLFGIGPTKSQAIVDYRKEHGSFKSIEDIMNVSGIKEGEFAKIKDYIKVK
jgi:competence protein ComEA